MPTDSELAGLSLHGNDFGRSEIEEWYRDEENAYAELYAENPGYEYEYEKVNWHHGFRHLPSHLRFATVCGLGSAFGDELRPIADRMDRLVVVESADVYQSAPALDVPTVWRKASVLGDVALPDASVDLTTCFGVLHHIPNVSHVVSEIGRITRSGGYALIREPVVSMGDWSRPRPGLTPRERGIPRDLLVAFCERAGFLVERESWCFFSGVSLLGRRLDLDVFDRMAWVRVDAMLSRALRFNYAYHARSRISKVRPTSVFLTLRKI